MRYLLFPILALCLGSTAGAAVANKDEAAEHHAVNTVDPVTGAAVDAKITLVEAKTSDGRTVWIATSNGTSAETIKGNPNKYADAAVTNKKAQ